MWRRAVETGLSHVRHIGITAVAKVVEEVLPVTFRITNAVSLLVLWTTAPVPRHTITCVVPREWMVALGVACIIPDFADITVGENQPVSKGGIRHVVDAKLPRDVVRGEGVIQLLVLQADLVVGYGRLHALVIPNIYDSISYFLGSTESPKVVVVFDDFNIVTHSLTTSRWLQFRVQ